jgi:glucose/arabinose dehydrogenase
MAGQRLFESAFVVLKGGNYGWNILEGTHCFDPNNNALVPNTTCSISGYRGEPLIGPIVELGHDLGNTIVGGVIYRGTALSGWQGKMIHGTWSDESRSVGNGTLLVSSVPQGFDLNSLPADALELTPAENRMWTTAELRVANNANGRINAFVRGIFTGVDGEAYLLINQNGGPGLQQGTGEIWKFVPASSANLVDTTTKQLPPSPGGGGY